MFTIDLHIRYLLMRHDYVVIPQLGAFVTQWQPACFDHNSGTFTPPSGQIGFNPDVNHTDPMLATSIARRQNISVAAAQNIIHNEVRAILQSLADNQVVTLSGLGTLLPGRKNTPRFVPMQQNIASWRHIGLPTLQLDCLPDNTSVVIPMPRTRARRWASIAASVAVLIGIGFMASTPVNINQTHLASLNIPQISKPHSAQLRETTSAPKVRTITLLKPSDADASATFTPLDNFSPTLSHYLIVASCSSRAEAQRYINRHNSDTLRLLEADGRFRVYINAANSRSTLEQEQQTVAQRYPGAWIFSRS